MFYKERKQKLAIRISLRFNSRKYMYLYQAGFSSTFQRFQVNSTLIERFKYLVTWIIDKKQNQEWDDLQIANIFDVCSLWLDTRGLHCPSVQNTPKQCSVRFVSGLQAMYLRSTNYYFGETLRIVHIRRSLALLI
jgi:hypothetical protein